MDSPTGRGASYRIGHMATDLKMQMNTIEAWARQRGADLAFDLHDEPAQVMGYGFRQDAPDFQKLLALAQAGEIQFVVIFSEERLSIHPVEFKAVVADLKARGVAVWSASNDECLTPAS